MNNEILKGSEKRILTVIVTVAVIALTHIFVVQPFNTKRAECEKKVNDINSASKTALAKIRDIQNMRNEFAAISNDVFVLTNSFVVRQVLGSYPMEKTIYQIAQKYKFRVTGCTELGKITTPDSPPAPIPAKGSKPPQKKQAKKVQVQHFFDRFQMDVKGEGSYWSIMRLISDLEELNPFFSVVSIEISANDSKPEIHGVQMRLEWPVDADPIPVSSSNNKKK